MVILASHQLTIDNNGLNYCMDDMETSCEKPRVRSWYWIRFPKYVQSSAKILGQVNEVDDNN